MNENEQILTYLLKCRRADLFSPTFQLTFSQDKLYQEILKRRQSGEPLQYILGSVDFMGVILNVKPGVLIPRPETEILVEAAVKLIGTDAIFSKAPVSNKKIASVPINILDLGTGSGNIAIALAKFVPGGMVYSVDISEDVLQIARENAKQNQVLERINFVRQDMREFMEEAWQRQIFFDMIISNPPYIPTSHLSTLPVDVQQEPALALDGGIDGLDFYRVIVSKAAQLLAPQGRLMMELGDGQFEEVAQMLLDNNWKNINFIEDYVKTKRIIYAEKL